MSKLRIGTAGWQLPADVRDRFAEAPSGLARYATRFACVEINSTFYRSHRQTTYERWVAATPENFRFAVKAPKTITHERRLVETADLISGFLAETAALGVKRGPVLIQLPPKLAFDPAAGDFLNTFRDLYDGEAAIEPRHATWFTEEVDALLQAFRIARVAADPPRAPGDGAPGGWTGLAYWRLHGSPRIYYSAYEEAMLQDLRRTLDAAPGQAWCIFDNTTSGAASRNGLFLLEA